MTEKYLMFTQKEVDYYNRMVGDNNPIHYDREFCAKTVFEAPIVPGLLTSSIFGGMFGTQLKDGAILLGMNLIFVAPIYINEQFKARIVEDKQNGKVTTYKLTCFKSDGVIAIEGTAKVICKRYKFQ